MRGRDPHEAGRTATPLELLFDLTFVVAVGVVADRFAQITATGQWGRAVLAFVFGMFAILVGWINYSWFASAFDTDDWAYRLCTMLQMAGVVVLALGLPAGFDSISRGGRIDVRMMVAGYVVMRVGMLLLWLRAARQSGRHAAVCRRNAGWIVLVQVGWVVVAALRLHLAPFFVVVVGLGCVELLIPVFAQGRADGTPWHPHHIAERYSAFAIICLGEGIVGTVASSRSVLSGATIGWDAGLVILAGVGLTFAMWWTYFLVPFGALLHRRPGRGYLFGYGHVPLLIAIAATGAGLHGAGLFLQHDSRLGPVPVTLGVAVPVALYLAAVSGLRRLLAGAATALHGILAGIAAALLAVAAALAAGGVPVPVDLLVVMLALFSTVVGYELAGPHREPVAAPGPGDSD